MKFEHRFTLALLGLLAAVLLLGSCKSMQSVEKVNYRDSVITHVAYDTTRITITDTIKVEASRESEKESDTDIVFGAGGGTYNTQTGEATNVVGVKQSKREKELVQLVADLTETIHMQHTALEERDVRITELEKELEEKQNTADIKPKRTGWDRFCTWYTIISWLLIILCIAWWALKKFYLHI